MPNNLPAQLCTILSLRDEYIQTDLKDEIDKWREECAERKKTRKPARKIPTVKQATIQQLYCDLLGKETSDRTGKSVGKVICQIICLWYLRSDTLARL